MKRHLPNLLTLTNLFCGCLALLALWENRPQTVFILLLVAAFADVFDGLVARALGVSGPLGQELDSLADMVTFGVMPGMAVYQLLAPQVAWAYVGFALPLAAALRLARFNIAPPSAVFYGLATPAATIWIVGWWLSIRLGGLSPATVTAMTDPLVLLLLTAVVSVAMVSRLPMFSLKIKGRRWRDYALPLLFLAGVAVAAPLLRWLTLPASIMAYVVLSLLQAARRRA